MKKLLCLMAFLALFLAGCSTQSDVWKHPTMYKNWDHLKFSWYGYENPTKETGVKSQDQDWWGNPVEGP